MEIASHLSNKSGLPETGYVRLAQLIPDIIPVSPATFWRMVKSGEFPKPLKISPRCTAWNVEDLRAWMEKTNAGGDE